jgi:integral membrane sensor domain MASE1
MSIITIALIAIFFLLIIMIGIGLRYPKGRQDWPLDRRTSTSIFLSVLVLILLIILSFFASQNVDWPENTVIFYYFSIIIFIILIVVAILMPVGLTGDES